MQQREKQQHNGVTALFYRHPAVAAAYYALLLVGVLALLRPAFACASLAALLLGAVQRQGLRQTLRFAASLLPLLLFIVVLQALTVHRGVTVLAYLPWDAPLTAESLRFGLLTAQMFASLLLLFAAAQADLAAGRGEKLLPASLPALLAYCSLVLRQVGSLKRDLLGIIRAQRSLDADFLRGKLNKRLADAAAALSLLFDLSVAGGMEAADLLAARGYGLRPRSNYRPFSWSFADALCLLLLAAVAVAMPLLGAFSWQAYAVNPPLDARGVAAVALWCLGILLPLLGKGGGGR